MIETFEELTVGEWYFYIVAGGELIAGRLLERIPLPSRIRVDFGGGSTIERSDFFGAFRPFTVTKEEIELRMAEAAESVGKEEIRKNGPELEEDGQG